MTEREEGSAEVGGAERFQALGQIAGELMHDLANVVAVVHGRASLALGDARAGRPATAELERLVESSEDLGLMLRDVLEVLRGRAVSTEVRFDPVRVIERTVRRFTESAPSLEIRLLAQLPPGAEVVGRASFLSRAVLNLLGNAARHARREIQLRLSAEEAEGGASVLVLVVEDDGAGVPAALLPQLFEPLVSGDRAGAAGLGLSSVRWAVEQLGGSVCCRRAVRLSGAAFEVRLPLRLRAAAVAAAPPSPPPAAAAVAAALAAGGGGRGVQQTQAVLRGKRLVLIEDDPAVEEALSRLLRRLGAEVVVLSPAGVGEEEILQRLLQALPDAVLLDLRLGRREGSALWRALHQQVPALAERVIFLSALGPGDALWDAAEQTGQPVLAKPLELSCLASALQHVCSSTR